MMNLPLGTQTIPTGTGPGGWRLPTSVTGGTSAESWLSASMTGVRGSRRAADRPNEFHITMPATAMTNDGRITNSHRPRGCWAPLPRSGDGLVGRWRSDIVERYLGGLSSLIIPHGTWNMIASGFPDFQPHALFRGGHAQTLAGIYLPGSRHPYRA